MNFSLMVCKIYKTFKNVQQPQKKWIFMTIYEQWKLSFGKTHLKGSFGNTLKRLLGLIQVL